MSSKGLLAVFLFSVSVLFSNLVMPWPNAFEWNRGTVVAGGTLDVKVTNAPCQPVTIVLTIGGARYEQQIQEAPGSVSFKVPEGTSGMDYTIQIRCPDSSVSDGGQVM